MDAVHIEWLPRQLGAGESFKPKLYHLDDRTLLFHCPGCDRPHIVRVGGLGPTWSWNQSMVAPSFEPDLIYSPQDASRRCHSRVKDGKIEFLNSTHHFLVGHTLVLPDWPDGSV